MAKRSYQLDADEGHEFGSGAITAEAKTTKTPKQKASKPKTRTKTKNFRAAVMGDLDTSAQTLEPEFVDMAIPEGLPAELGLLNERNEFGKTITHKPKLKPGIVAGPGGFAKISQNTPNMTDAEIVGQGVAGVGAMIPGAVLGGAVGGVGMGLMGGDTDVEALLGQAGMGAAGGKLFNSLGGLGKAGLTKLKAAFGYGDEALGAIPKEPMLPDGLGVVPREAMGEAVDVTDALNVPFPGASRGNTFHYQGYQHEAPEVSGLMSVQRVRPEIGATQLDDPLLRNMPVDAPGQTTIMPGRGTQLMDAPFPPNMVREQGLHNYSGALERQVPPTLPPNMQQLGGMDDMSGLMERALPNAGGRNVGFPSENTISKVVQPSSMPGQNKIFGDELLQNPPVEVDSTFVRPQEMTNPYGDAMTPFEFPSGTAAAPESLPTNVRTTQFDRLPNNQQLPPTQTMMNPVAQQPQSPGLAQAFDYFFNQLDDGTRMAYLMAMMGAGAAGVPLGFEAASGMMQPPVIDEPIIEPYGVPLPRAMPR